MTWQPGHVTTKLQRNFRCGFHQTLSHLIWSLTSPYMHLLNIYGWIHQSTRGGKLQLPAREATAPESIQGQVDFWQHFKGEEGEFWHITPLRDPYNDPYGIMVNSSSSCLCPLLPVPPLSPPPPAGLSLATVCVCHAQSQVPRGDRQNALPLRHVSRDCGHARTQTGRRINTDVPSAPPLDV